MRQDFESYFKVKVAEEEDDNHQMASNLKGRGVGMAMAAATLAPMVVPMVMKMMGAGRRRKMRGRGRGLLRGGRKTPKRHQVKACRIRPHTRHRRNTRL